MQYSTSLQATAYQQSFIQPGGTSTFHSQPTSLVKVPVSSPEAPVTDAVGGDQVTLSRQGLQLAQTNGASPAQEEKQPNQVKSDQESSQKGELSQEEQKAVEELKNRDSEVRTHEMAHLSSAGQYAAGGPSFTYQQGPDGKRYAVGGEVPIDVSAEKTPEETIAKMRIVRQAAMAPANPSGADRQIAATASSKEAQARQELASQQMEGEDKTTAIAAEKPETEETTVTVQDDQPQIQPESSFSGFEAVA